MSMIEITDDEFNLIRSFIYEKIGIYLSDRKRNLVAGRLQKIVRSKGYKSFKEYYYSVVADKSGLELSKLASFISTNYTYFNREKEHFNYFYSTALPATLNLLKSKNNNDIRIWCAGCASGEEPYMLVMLMLEYFGKKYFMWDAGILATDISAKALDAARKGIYTKEKIKALPPYYIGKYFDQIDNELWEIKSFVKREVTFRQFNLINKAFPFKRPFNIIFCRNVMIYFDKKTRDALLERFYTFTAKGGYLFVGHSESLMRGDSDYEYVIPAVYKRSR